MTLDVREMTGRRRSFFMSDPDAIAPLALSLVQVLVRLSEEVFRRAIELRHCASDRYGDGELE